MAKNYFDISSKVIVLTGANGLIGRTIGAALLEQGGYLVELDVNFTQAPEIADFNKHLRVNCDIKDPASIEKAKDQILEKFGRIDALINLAAINDKFEADADLLSLTGFENYPLAMWQASLDVNLTGLYLCCQILGSEIAKQKRGSIVNVASTYGLVGPDQNLYVDGNGKQLFYKSPSYPATKGAVVNFSRYLAAYWGKDNVRVNTLCPGGVEDSQEEWFVKNYAKRTCLGRMAKPDDYIGSILFLISDSSSYMTGANLVVDGGWTAI